jgi:hypothetical protein
MRSDSPWVVVVGSVAAAATENQAVGMVGTKMESRLTVFGMRELTVVVGRSN